MDLIQPLAEAYAEKMTSPENDLLHRINSSTYTSHAQPHMLSGHIQGRLLSFLSQMQRPRFILEIGTFTGYSALCLAEGLTPDGQLHTLELNPEDVKLSQKHFDQSDFKDKIHIHQGPALEIIPTLPYQWDLVFIDADKTNYIAYYDLVVDRLSPGGIILADNVLFHGQVLEEPLKGKNPKAIAAFNQHVRQDDRTEQVLMTVRDGLFMIKKKK